MRRRLCFCSRPTLPPACWYPAPTSGKICRTCSLGACVVGALTRHGGRSQAPVGGNGLRGRGGRHWRPGGPIYQRSSRLTLRLPMTDPSWSSFDFIGIRSLDWVFESLGGGFSPPSRSSSGQRTRNGWVVPGHAVNTLRGRVMMTTPYHQQHVQPWLLGYTAQHDNNVEPNARRRGNRREGAPDQGPGPWVRVEAEKLSKGRWAVNSNGPERQ